MNRYSRTVFLMRQITKQHLNFNHAWNHNSYCPDMASNIPSRQKRGIFSVMYNFLFGPTESKNVIQLKKNVAPLM